jgi:hypothetical protein
MSHNYEIKRPQETTTAKPRVTSYDSGYEHSIEHWIEVRQMVEESAEEITVVEESRELVLSV